MKLLKTFALFIFAVLCISCNNKTASVLSAQADTAKIPLYALNKNAESAEINKKQGSGYMYFAFDECSGWVHDGKALQVKLDFAKVQHEQENEPPKFCFGWLFDEDFTAPFKLAKTLGSHPFVTGKAENALSISIAVPQDKNVRGFFVYSDVPAKVESAEIADARTGWSLKSGTAWYGFGSDGGAIGEITKPVSISSKSAMKLTVQLTEDPVLISKYAKQVVRLNVGGTGVDIQIAPRQKNITLYPSLLQREGAPQTASIVNGSALVQGLIFEPVLPVDVATPLAPIVTEPGLIANWPASAWRRDDFEVFSWEQFPSILFFDTKNYYIQDLMFKRLAFFVEKAGYAGKLVSDSVMKNQHGFNAHDYRAESLANFFELARVNNFPLNEYELLLRDILIGHGIITVRNDGSYSAGLGALVSISQESSNYLRWKFIAHEGLHCIYFTNSDFRTVVADVFSQCDRTSLEFLLKYFSVTPSLNYDINDTYLIQNEFMAYLLQQQLSEVADYFTKILATKRTINEKCPDLVNYVLETDGRAFYEAAVKLDSYLAEKWGFASGRIWLVRTTKLQ